MCGSLLQQTRYLYIFGTAGEGYAVSEAQFNVVSDYREMIGKVDAIILARDDPHNHWEMVRPFIQAGMPIYIDKVLAHTFADYHKILSAAGEHSLLMAGSSSRFTTAIRKARQQIDPPTVRSVHGISPVSWIRYGNHLLDGISVLFGADFKTVQNVGEEGCDVVRLVYRNGLNVLLEVVDGVAGPIDFTCYQKTGGKHIRVPFADEQDKLESYFWGFYGLLDAFTQMVKSGRRPDWYEDMLSVSRAIIAGELSKQRGGVRIDMDTIDREIPTDKPCLAQA